MCILSKKISSITLIFTMIIGISMGLIFSTPQKAQATQPDAVYNNGDTWIGTDGNEMSAEYARQWKYKINYNGNSISLDKYSGSFTSDGQINGVVPASINGLPVTSMSYTFCWCDNLVEAPIIPESVTSMHYTFFGCSNLIYAPVIPNGVVEMDDTFAFCSSLVTAPEIPNSVKHMGWTYARCGSLEIVPAIPDSVKNMCYTFLDCYSLTVRPIIPTSVEYPIGVFYGLT